MFLRRNQKFNFSYDKENDDLLLFNPKSKSKGSVEMGNIIFDYNNKREFVGIQIMNASKMIKEMSDGNSNNVKEVLNNLRKCKVETIQQDGLLIVKIHLLSKLNEIAPVISIPSISESSPALAYA